MLLTVCLFILCVTVLFVSHCFALSWPGRSCKWELVLNWPTWLNKGEKKTVDVETGVLRVLFNEAAG